jgi:branched-chain amino acid transport system substrate-binding protein
MNSGVRRLTKLTFLIVLSLTLVVALLLSACGGGTPTVEKVKVGLSLTYTGPMATTTSPISDGIQAYMKYVNDQGGIQYTDPTSGATKRALLDIDWEDNGYDSGKVTTVYQTQKQWGMDLELLVMSPDVIAATASRNEVPVLSAGNLAAASMATQPVYVSVLYGSYVDQVLAFTQWASTQQATPVRIAWVALNIPAFQSAAGGAGITDELLKQYGGTLVDRENVDVTATDISIQLTRVKAANPDYVILQLIPSTISVAMQDAQMIGMPKSVKFVAITTFDENLVPILGNESEGLMGLLSWSFATEYNIQGVQFANQVMETYYGHSVTTDNIWGISLAMTAVGGIQKALNTVGFEKLTPSAVNDGLHSLTNLDTMGLTEPVTMTPDYPVASQHIKIGVIENGQINALSGWVQVPRLGLTLP